MNFKKRVNGSWVGIPNYIHNTSTDTIATLPAVLYPTATTATVGLKGQTVQSGTPTSDSPIVPQGTGERTWNLFDMSFYEGKSGITVSGNKATGKCDRFFNVKLSIPPELYGQELTWSAYLKRPDNPNTVRLQTADNESYKYGNNITGEGRSTVSFTATSTIKLYVNYANTGSDTIELSDITLNLGSTALPYEPWGVKIPILSAGQTTPVYLGEVQSARRVKKLVLTGEETNWAATAAIPSGRNRFYLPLANAMTSDTSTPRSLCSHLPLGASGATFDTDNVYTIANSNVYIRLTIEYNSLSDFKTYLAAQYAAGTPVCVWYVLATEETAVINEPLMRIGDYADTLSNVSIPVTAGGDTLSVGTTVQPSEVTVNYKGWHPVADVHEKSKNLFDKSKRTDKSRVVYTTGEIGALNGTFVSDFTPIEPNTTYTLNIVSSISDKTGHLFALYDENKDFVNTGTHEATSATVYTFTTPSNVAYIRFNGDMSSVDSTMLNEGSTALPYEPYWK